MAGVYKIAKLADIRPYDGNPRNITDEAIAAVCKSISTVGFRGAIIVDSHGIILAGHTRYFAAKQLKMAEVPVIVYDDITPAEARAFRILDNKTAEFSSWDINALEKELQLLSNMEFDINSLAIDEQFSSIVDEINEAANAVLEAPVQANVTTEAPVQANVTTEAPVQANVVSTTPRQPDVVQESTQKMVVLDWDSKSTEEEQFMVLLLGEASKQKYTRIGVGLLLKELNARHIEFVTK